MTDISDDDELHCENVAEFRMFVHRDDSNFVILRVKTQSAEIHNFGFDRAGITQIIRQWAFDLGALEAAAEGRAPHPGKPVGSPDRKAN